ncbi:MAG: hypothetical protein K6E67_08420 [Prevotella sp.]|nr:hypothetical protein [Prevotella sp.]
MFKYTPLYANGKEPAIEEQDLYRIDLLLSAGGRIGISSGGGGSNGELTNWDGTKKKTSWGVG